MASIFKRDNGTWVIKWKDGAGRYRQRRTTCVTKTEAKELARELERKAEFQRLGLAPIERPVLLTFAELLDLYWSSEGAQLRSQHMRPFANKHLSAPLGALALMDVTSARIDELLTAKSTELEARSINHLRGFIHRLFSFAKKRGAWQGVNPASGVSRRKVPKRAAAYLKPDEVREVLPHVPEQWRCLFATAVYTGMRRGELVALRKGDVDLEGGTLTVAQSWHADTTKSSRVRLVPIHPELKPYLVTAMRASPSELVFPRADGTMHSQQIDLASVLRSALNRAQLVEGWVHKCRRCSHAEHAATADPRRCPKEGCGFALWPSPKPRRIKFHSLRHTTATLLLKAGVPLPVVQRILGHSSPAITTEVYGHLDVEDMRAGLERLSFKPVEQARADVVPLVAANADGAPVVRNRLDPKTKAGPAEESSTSPASSMVGETGFEPQD